VRAPVRRGAECAQRIRGAEHVDLDWAGDLPSLEDPTRFNPLLLEFLRSTTSV
jgi:3-oxoadipate enol-lactonase